MNECEHEFHLTFHADFDVYSMSVFTCDKCGKKMVDNSLRSYESFINMYSGDEDPKAYYERRVKELEG